jgi:hypothetical protein
MTMQSAEADWISMDERVASGIWQVLNWVSV